MCAMVKSRYIGDGHPTFNRNPYNGYINPYYWVDDHPLLYGNNGSLDPGTCKMSVFFQEMSHRERIGPKKFRRQPVVKASQLLFTTPFSIISLGKIFTHPRYQDR